MTSELSEYEKKSAKKKVRDPVPSHILLNTGRKVLDRRTFVSSVETADRLWGTTILSNLEDDTIFSSKEIY